MRRTSSAALSSTLILLALGSQELAAARANPRGDDLVRGTLWTDSSAMVPGKPFTVGVRLKIEPRWHIYWSNPGDAGLPTKVALTLPAGFTAGEVKYPTPMRFSQEGGVVIFGYEDEVTLLVPVTPPADLKPGAKVAIGAAVKWLVCNTVCLPGQAELKVELPCALTAAPANEVALKAAAALLPVDAAKSADVKSISSRRVNGKVVLTVDWARAADQVDLFPAADERREIKIGSIATKGRKTEIELDVRTLAGQTPAAKTLPVEIAYVSDGGQRRSVRYQIDF